MSYICIVKIFLSIACEVLIKNNVLVYGHECIYTTSDRRSVVCQNTHMHDVPRHLDPGIEEITFVNDTFDEMGENSFTSYRNLTAISIKNVAYTNRINPIHVAIFKNLQNLRRLAIDNVYTDFEPTFVLPSGLRNLSLSRNDFIESVNLTDAASLSHFYAYRCTLRTFPRFHPLAPIVTVDVRWNPLDNWTVEDLAPYCLLNNLRLQWDANAILTRPDNYCRCRRLAVWIMKYNLSRIKSLNCTPTSNKRRCDYRYSDTMMNQRAECLRRHKRHDWISNTGIPVLVIPAVVALFSLRVRAQYVKTVLEQFGKHKRDRKQRMHDHTTKTPEKFERGGEPEFEEQPIDNEEELDSDGHEQSIII